ncbi:MAG: hypothetical protein PHU17_01240 [Candidatus Pacebacteria bacterium]|nr:hypothetical protein [Candidatus Paceibacterota bacterium]MDD4074134.1 hypothetical protein [Candidatus Paceibacterota bacterium]
MEILYIILIFILFIALHIFLIKRVKDQTTDFLIGIKNSFLFQSIILMKLISKIIKKLEK